MLFVFVLVFSVWLELFEIYRYGDNFAKFVHSMCIYVGSMIPHKPVNQYSLFGFGKVQFSTIFPGRAIDSFYI